MIEEKAKLEFTELIIPATCSLNNWSLSDYTFIPLKEQNEEEFESDSESKFSSTYEFDFKYVCANA